MSTSSTSMLRWGLRAACRRHISCQPTRLIGRRSYASGAQHHGTKSSDLPWQAGAVGVTVVGSLWLWSRYVPSNSKKEAHPSHGDAAKEENHGNSVEKTADNTINKVVASHDPINDDKTTGGSGDSGHVQNDMDDSTDNQTQKLTHKPASKRVDPTEK